MKGKATISESAKPDLFEVFSGKSGFARTFIIEVIENIFEAKYARFRPAEYYVQKPDEMAAVHEHFHGVIFTVSGISRTDQREPKVFHSALKRTVELCVIAIQTVLDENEHVQLFVNMMLTGDVPVPPPGTGYTSVLESQPIWVSKRSVSDGMPPDVAHHVDMWIEEERQAKTDA